MPWTYLARRLLLVPVTLIGVFTVTFALTYVVPGDPVRIMMGDRKVLTAEDMARVRAEWGLDDPWHARYLHYLEGVVKGDLGRSYRSQAPVLSLLLERFPATALLAVTSVVVGALLGVPLGVACARRQDTWLDRTLLVGTIAGISAPGFWLAVLGMYALGVKLHLLPIGGYGRPSHLVLPVLVLAVSVVATWCRLTRTMVLEVMGSDYVRTARAKGLGERVVMYRHVLRNALIPVVTSIGIGLAALLGGTAIIEQVFAWPGIGKLVLDAVNYLDYPVIQGGNLFFATITVFVNLAVDLLYGVLDPRVSYR